MLATIKRSSLQNREIQVEKNVIFDQDGVKPGSQNDYRAPKVL
jgi:hypothetical protein